MKGREGRGREVTGGVRPHERARKEAGVALPNTHKGPYIDVHRCASWNAPNSNSGMPTTRTKVSESPGVQNTHTATTHRQLEH